MKRLLAGLIATSLLASAQAQTPEPPLDPHPIATILFVVLFVGFFVVFGWMVWRNRGKDKKEEKKAKP
jgi:heme/copper-type cytochrome/quinol oxidase subunit 2